MDILKQELLMKRQILSEQSGGRKVFNRSQIEQKCREEKKPNASQNPNSSDPSNPIDSTKSKPGSSDDQKPDLPKQEVIRRLRSLKQPVTLFGESDHDRLDRLKYVLQAGLFELDDSDMTDGQTNDFLKDMVDLKRVQKSGDRKRRATDDVSGYDTSFKRMKTSFSELCDEDKIVVFLNNLLIEWKDEMIQMEKTTARGKATFATFKQCARYLNPLFNFCRKKVLRDEIKQALMLVVNCCMKRDYVAAFDHYIRIAIGNSPWPIGVTMVGIHERSAREKIYTNSVAHVMNDETTRKYLTSVRRLITYCETRHPAMPSKAVEVIF